MPKRDQQEGGKSTVEAHEQRVGGGFGLFQALRELKHHLYWFTAILILVVTVRVGLELLAVAGNLVPTLLNGNRRGNGTHIGE